MLEGIVVLDLASVGPAARTSRWLADYGARVVKVGPPPKQSGVQIVPPFYAYSGHRGMERVLLDLKSDAGRDAFLRLADQADVVIESFRPGVVDRLGIGDAAVRARNPRIVYCSTSGYGQTGPRSQWAGHDINYLALGGYLDCSGRNSDGGPALPGATIGDAAGKVVPFVHATRVLEDTRLLPGTERNERFAIPVGATRAELIAAHRRVARELTAALGQAAAEELPLARVTLSLRGARP